jgi:7,8-dihydropterin-6-yl-methyl-4-(beta-D-ribofuranosyl)aminobenzene 5'-phosphate synthase
MFGTRAMKAPDGSMRPFDDVPSAAQLAQQGAEVIETTAPQRLLDDLFFVSGEIPRTSAFETGLQGQYRLGADGRWTPDPLLVDERFVAVDVKDKGVVVFTACSHAGVVNVLTHARDVFPGRPLHGVVGGLHLAGGNEGVIAPTVEALQGFGLRTIAAGHCTGWRALGALHAAFGDAVVPSAVGKLYHF